MALTINLQGRSVNCFPEDSSGPERLSTTPKGRDQSAAELGLEPSSACSKARSPSSWLRDVSPDIQLRLQRRTLKEHLLPTALCGSRLLLRRERQPCLPPCSFVVRTCLCVLCPSSELVCVHCLLKLAALSPETPQSSLVITCETAWRCHSVRRHPSVHPMG